MPTLKTRKVKNSSTAKALKTNKLAAALTEQANVTTTHNGAVSNKSTLSSLLDFFGNAGAMRSRAETEVTNAFSKAYAEDKTLALKALFYLSDVRGGQGERRLFRLCYNWLATYDVSVAKNLLKYIPEYTRWDNVLEALDGSPLEKEALSLVAKQLRADLKSEQPSLAAKWAPSENTSSAATRKLASKLRQKMKLTSRSYRKMLSALREKINIVERQMCAGEWDKIDYSKVPSKATLLYKGAFSKHAPDKFSKFLTKVEKGEEKINAGVLYPYDIVRQILSKSGDEARTLEAQWKALPDYLADNPHNGLVIADTSGSMDSSGYYGGDSNGVRPIDVAGSLAIYFAERNVGPFKNQFMIFNDRAEFLTLSGYTLKSKYNSVLGDRPCGGTNLQSAFEKILSTALQHNVPESDMPDVIYIISDMQFDGCVRGGTNYDTIKRKYAAAGYTLPKIVFWCVNSYNKDNPITIKDENTALVSGCSPTIFKTVLSGCTPLQTMLKTINAERYAPIKA